VISLISPENVPSLGFAENLGMTVRKEVMWGRQIRKLHLVYRSDRPVSAPSITRPIAP
jgi:hypothetical protein